MAEEEAWWSGWGRWQARLALLLALPVLLTGAYGTNYVFLAAPTEYRCFVPECEANPGVITSAEDWSPKWTRWALPNDTRCHRQASNHDTCLPSSFDNHTVACDQFVYQQGGSIVSEFQLACQEWKRTLVGTVHNVGMLISLPLMGLLSDRYGRRAALVVSGCGAGVVGVCKSFAGSYGVYLLAELLETVAGASVYPAAFVLMIEWLGVEQRVLASLVLGIPLSMGAVSLSLLDYLTGSWRWWARIAYPPSFLLLLYPWLLPESARWLLTRGRLAEATALVKQAAKWNKLKVPEESMEQLLRPHNDKRDTEESVFTALCKYSVLRGRLLVCCVWWWSAVLVFYGVAVRAHALAGSAHVNYALVAAAELPALALNTLLLGRAGRRATLITALLLTATSLTSMSMLPTSAGRWRLALYLGGKVGATMTLNALYVYSAEVYPTRARHSLLAASSAAGRLGAVLAPLTPLLAAYGEWVPTAVLGALPVLSAALTPLVPDTLHARLPDSFADLAAPPDTV